MPVRRLDDPFFAIDEPRAEGLLAVGDGHCIHWSDSGAADGAAWIEVHGGPGSGANPAYRGLIDGRRCRIIQFDQRGCGASTPAGELVANSLEHTIADMEALRDHLRVEHWIVGGASWGSTVALAYAEAHPERCMGVKVSGVWLARPRDVAWWYRGVREIFPELWEAYAAPIPEAERSELRRAYHARIMSADPAVSAPAAIDQFLYEDGFMRFEPTSTPPTPDRGLAYSRIFAHYAINDFWLRPNQLIEDAPRLAGVPVSLTTGRYDMCATPVQAWDMARALEPARVRLQIAGGAGHNPFEPAMARAIALETTAFLDWLDREGRL